MRCGAEADPGAASGAGAAKHAIKRCWRFIANDRIEPSLVMAGDRQANPHSGGVSTPSPIPPPYFIASL
jgi:hypothetical protein